MTNAHGVARDQLRAFIERIERLEEEKKTIADDIKDVYAEAKGMGFIPAMMKKVIALRKKDEQERMEEEAILDTYLHALGMIQADLFEEPHHPETGEIIDPKLAQTIVTGMQTETGRKALIAAVDIMIAREEAIEESPRKAAEAVSERTAFQGAIASDLVEADKAEAVAEVLGQPETISALTVQHDGVNVGGPEKAGVTVVGTESGTVAISETHERPSENDKPCSKAVPQDAPSPAGIGSGLLAGREGRHEGEAASVDLPTNSEIAPASQGEAEAPSADRISPEIHGSAGANAGGDHVTAHSSAAKDTAGALVKPAPAKPIRPHCRNPGERCGGYGSTHCASCLKAAREAEVAA